MTNIKTIGQTLCKLRECAGYNQQNIAEFLGVDQSLVCKYEKGERGISAEMLDKLAALFGVSASDIINDEAAEKPLACAFRRSQLSSADMDVIAAINKIALNAELMSRLLKDSAHDKQS